MATTTSSTRLDVRLGEEQKRLIEQAAGCPGQTILRGPWVPEVAEPRTSPVFADGHDREAMRNTDTKSPHRFAHLVAMIPPQAIMDGVGPELFMA